MVAAHPLDRPVWNALLTRQAELAQGDRHALRFDPTYEPFAASADDSAESLAALAKLVAAEGETWVVEAADRPPPPGVTVVRTALLHQMAAAAIVPPEADLAIVSLTDADAAEMRALAHLTRPGPFLANTHRLGGFVGIKQDGRLVAMAGERMKPAGFTEVSGVCTHPDHRGRGYANQLMRIVAHRILMRGETPFLHVYASNSGAIALYQSLGFSLRSPMFMTVLARP